MTELSDRVNVLENELEEYASTCRSLKKALSFAVDDVIVRIRI